MVRTRIGLGIMCAGLLLAYGAGGFAYLWVLWSLLHYNVLLAGIWLLPGTPISLVAGELLAIPLQFLGVVLVTQGRRPVPSQQHTDLGTPRLTSAGEA